MSVITIENMKMCPDLYKESFKLESFHLLKSVVCLV